MLHAAGQRHRINRVVNFVQSHFADALSLDDMADVACLSKFHFTRVFNDHIKETPGKFVWRLRLENAARALVYDREKPITDVAMDCGFSSPQTFSCAFRQRFLSSPRDFRSINNSNFDGFPLRQRPTAIRPDLKVTTDRHAPQVVVEKRPSYRVAYVRNLGSYGNPNGGISTAFETLFRWTRARWPELENASYIGICPSSPALTPMSSCIYDAGILVPDDVREDEVVSIQTVAAGTYATLHNPVFDESAGFLGNQVLGWWEWLTDSWLPGSGYLYAPHDCYEFFPSGLHREFNLASGIELCLRIRSH